MFINCADLFNMNITRRIIIVDIYHRSYQRKTGVKNGISIENNQSLACGYCVPYLDARGKYTAVKMNGINTNMDKNLITLI